MSGDEAVAPLMSPEVSIKLFVDDQSIIRPLELIGVFQRWIKEGALEDELVIGETATVEASFEPILGEVQVAGSPEGAGIQAQLKDAVPIAISCDMFI